MTDQLKLREDDVPAALVAGLRSRLLESVILLEPPSELPELALVRPLVEDARASWAEAAARESSLEKGSIFGVISDDRRLAALVACSYASWAGDRGTSSVVVDGNLEEPSIDKPLREDGDEGLVDALRFGVSASSVARRTLAPGVRVVTAGSHPLSVAGTLNPEKIRSFMRELDAELSLLVLPPDYVDMVAAALDGGFVVGGDAHALVGEAERARAAGVERIIAVHVASAAGGARRPEEAAEGEEAVEPQETVEAPVVSAGSLVRQERRRSRLEPREESTRRKREKAPVPAESPFLPEEEPVVTAATGPPPRRRSRAGIGVAVALTVAVVAIWFAFGPGGSDRLGRLLGPRASDEQLADAAGASEAETAGAPVVDEDGTLPRHEAGQDEEAVVEDRTQGRDEAGDAGGVAEQAGEEEGEVPSEGTREEARMGPGDAAGDEQQAQAEGEGAGAGEDGLISGPGGPYVVYLSSHRIRSAAESDVGRALARGISAVVVDADLEDSGTWHRVAISGGFGTLAGARDVLDIVKELGYEGAWVDLLGRRE